MIVLAEGRFGPLESKTANQALRYIPGEVVAIVDSQNAGRTAGDVLGFGGRVPVVADVRSALSFRPDTFLIGVAPAGGKLPPEWRPAVRDAILHRLTIVSGLHTLIGEDPEFAQLSEADHVRVIDLRKVPPEYERVSRGSWRTRTSKTVLTVGTDCNVGKMTASVELHREFLRRGLRSEFVATGQTGILLSGEGVAVDSVLSDYVSGAVEYEIDRRASRNSDFIHVEGQGSLTHQGYSAVTLGLLHGVMPDAMVMVHHPRRHLDDYGLRIDDLRKIIELHEAIVAPFKTSRVAGIALNGATMTEGEINEARHRIEEETGLTAVDVLTPDVCRLADAVIRTIEHSTPHVSVK